MSAPRTAVPARRLVPAGHAPDPRAPAALAVFCRVSGRANRKPRPSWFSKPGCLRSMLQALDVLGRTGLPVRTTFVVDGPLDPEVDRVLERADAHVLAVRGGSSRRSMLNLYDAAVDGSGADDLVWLAEDDYVYAPEAFVELVAAVGALDADYFALHHPDDDAWHRTHPSQPLSVQPFASRRVDVPARAHTPAREWMTITHSTSTFGVRAAALRRDRRLVGLVTRAGSPFAHATNMTVQGRRPYAWNHLGSDAHWSWRPRQWPLSTLRAPMRVAVNIAAARQRRRHPTEMVAPRADLICHAEQGYVTGFRDWGTVLRTARADVS